MTEPRPPSLPFRLKNIVPLGRWFLDAWFPRRCLASGVVLGASEQGFSAPCRANADLLAAERYCTRCGSTLGEETRSQDGCVHCPRYPVRWSRLVRVGAYKGAWADAIRAYKFNGRVDGRTTLIEYLLAALWDEPRPAGIVPVPQHWRRTLERKFNPVRMLADELSHRWNVPVMPLLRRRKHSVPFLGLPRSQRRELARQLFAPGFQPMRLKALRERAGVGDPPCGVLLLDDITTTRSTLSACATILTEMGFAVRTAVLATAEQD